MKGKKRKISHKKLKKIAGRGLIDEKPIPPTEENYLFPPDYFKKGK